MVEQEELNIRLYQAAWKGQPGKVKELIVKGADVNWCDDGHFGNKQSTFHVAAEKGSLSVLKLLVEHGVNVHAVDEKDMTGLHYAARSGVAECISYLSKLRIDINAKAVFDQTALSVAIINGHRECVKRLIEFGADINIVDLEGRDAIEQAKKWGKQDYIPMMEACFEQANLNQAIKADYHQPTMEF